MKFNLLANLRITKKHLAIVANLAVAPLQALALLAAVHQVINLAVRAVALLILLVTRVAQAVLLRAHQVVKAVQIHQQQQMNKHSLLTSITIQIVPQ